MTRHGSGTVSAGQGDRLTGNTQGTLFEKAWHGKSHGVQGDRKTFKSPSRNCFFLAKVRYHVNLLGYRELNTVPISPTSRTSSVTFQEGSL